MRWSSGPSRSRTRRETKRAKFKEPEERGGLEKNIHERREPDFGARFPSRMHVQTIKLPAPRAGVSPLPLSSPSATPSASPSPVPSVTPTISPSPSPSPTAGVTCLPLAANPTASVGGFSSNLYTWYDAGCKARSAAMVKNDVKDPAGRFGGYLRQFTYDIGGALRTVGSSNSTHPGFGMVINHYGNGMTNASLSQYGTGTYTPVFVGRHHAIHEYKWRLNMGGPVDVTVRWFFATGRDNPVYAITFDSRPAGANVVNADTRAPYGDIDWDGGVNADVDGVGWGDQYKFLSTGAPVRMSSGWDYSQPNTIPYAMEWSKGANAEMGIVQTQTYLQHDAGGYWGYDRWGKTNPAGPMPEDYNWPFQLNQYELPFTLKSKRLAWGANQGAVGQTSYPSLGYGRNLVGYPYQSYSVHVVLGRTSMSPVAGQVSEVEAIQRVSLASAVGSILTAGPAGVGRTDDAPYAPAGYSPIFGTFEVKADASSAALIGMNVSSGAVSNPLIVVNEYRAQSYPATIRVNGATQYADIDYFPSLDAANMKLYLTFKGSFSGSNRIEIAP